MLSLRGRQRVPAYASEGASIGATQRRFAIAATISGPIPLASLALLIVAAYAPYVGDYFVGGDTWAHIWTSRDLGQVLTQPIMAGSTFPETVARFYRPVSSLSYTLQYALWGLNSAAFHVGDLVIHLLAMLTLAGLAIGLGVRRWAAALGAAVVALHPVMASVVPAAPRRHDSLVTIGLCVGLTLVVRYVQSRRSSVWLLVLSSAALGFAELAKEIGYVGVLLVVPTMLAACVGPRLSLRVAWRRFAYVLAAWTAVSVALFVWHSRVVGGLGGYGPLESFKDVDVRLNELIQILLWPFRANLQTYLKAWLIEGGLVLLVAALPMVVVHRRAAAMLGLGWAWLILSGCFQLMTQSTAPWQTYVTVAGFGLIIAGILDGAPSAWFRGAILGGASSVWLGRGVGFRTGVASAATLLRRAVLAVSLTGVIVFSAAVVRDSVLVTPYPEWHAAGSVAQSYLAAIRGCVDAVPAGESVVLADWPLNVDDATDQFRLIVAGVFAPYSVAPAVYLTMNHPGLEVRAQPSEISVGPSNRGISATCREQGGAWLVDAVYDPPLRQP